MNENQFMGLRIKMENGELAILKEEPPKIGFPLPAVTYLAENLSGLKIFCSLSFIDRELFCFPPISFLLPSDLRSGILLFLLLVLSSTEF